MRLIKMMLFRLVFSFMMIAFASGVYGVTIPASEDTSGSANKLMLSVGAASSLTVDRTRTSYLYFDLNDIPADAIVRWAKLRLFLPLVRTKGAGLGVHLVTSQWNEALASSQPSIESQAMAVIGPEKLGSKRFVTVDLSSAVQKWISGDAINEGIAIAPVVNEVTSPAVVVLTSKEGPSIGLPAELDIEFQPAEITFDQLPPALRAYFTPTIAGQPSAPTIGGSLAVQAQGLGSLTYRWLHDGMPIANETGAQLPADNLTAGTYAVEVSNGFASTISQVVRISAPVVPPVGPTIVVQPAVSANGGSLTVQASGAGALSYQWKWDGVPVANATMAWLPTAGLVSGSYTVGVSGGGSTTTSETVWISAASTPLAPSPPAGFVFVSGGTLVTASISEGVAVSGFYIGATEVTFGQWKTVLAWAQANGYEQGTLGKGIGDNHPVTDVSWHDALKWCNARSQMEGRTPVYTVNGEVYKSGELVPAVNSSATGYRLPELTEWNYAAMGGNQRHGYAYSGGNDLSAVGWYLGNAGGTIHEVGSKMANELSIFDMSGNAWEWCFTESIVEGVSRRTLQGGNFRLEASASQLSTGIGASTSPDSRFSSTGFRVAFSTVNVQGQNGDFNSPSTPQGFAIVVGGLMPSFTSELAAVSGFYIGKTEITYGEWKTVLAWAQTNGYEQGTVGKGVGDNYPVTDLSWHDTLKWCNARSQREGRTPVYTVNGEVYKSGELVPAVNAFANGYRLPEVTEWNYAAKGGTQSQGYNYSGGNDLNTVGWHSGNADGTTHEVGTKEANELGLFDMSGNAWEWCFTESIVSGEGRRSLQGGNFREAASASQLSTGTGPSISPNSRFSTTGFRLVLGLGQ